METFFLLLFSFCFFFFSFFFFNDTATTEIYTLSLHDALPILTPAPLVSAWTVNTLEQVHIQKRLLELGVTILANQSVTRFDGAVARLACVFTGRESERPVAARLPEDGLARDLAAAAERVAAAGIRSITAIGDGLAPGTIAAAVYAGHR